MGGGTEGDGWTEIPLRLAVLLLSSAYFLISQRRSEGSEERKRGEGEFKQIK